MSIDVDQMASVVEKPRRLGRHIVSTYTSLMCLNHIFFLILEFWAIVILIQLQDRKRNKKIEKLQKSDLFLILFFFLKKKFPTCSFFTF